ncbi:MAG: YhcH/YjgK/YiaL family protein [Clostridia bacterium]|nr:YhcH/YjgK/YiaL family protein [Clostridia bacterium]
MIIDNIKNAAKYKGLNEYFDKAFEIIAAFAADTEDKKYIIDGEKAFINLSTYVNKNVSGCKFESHAKYADIQFVVTGHEYIDVCDTQGLSFTENNLENGDIAFYENPETYTRADLKPGDFVVLFPGEAHRPLVAPDGNGIKTKKAVVKVLL